MLVKVTAPELQFIIWLTGFTTFTGTAVFWPMAKVCVVEQLVFGSVKLTV